MDAGNLELSVVIPVHNEADNIAPLIAEIRAALDGRTEYELIYVDDGSTDDTLERLLQARAEFGRLRVLHHRHACGQSTAILTGVRAARAPWVATLDGDGQNDPADISALFALLKEHTATANLHLVGGHRRKRRDTPLRRLASRVANGVRRRLLNDDTSDTGCGLKLFSRAAFLALPHFDHMHRFLPALIQRNGGQVRSVEVNHRARARGTSKYGIHNRLWVGIVDIVGVMWLQRRAKLPVIIERE